MLFWFWLYFTFSSVFLMKVSSYTLQLFSANTRHQLIKFPLWHTARQTDTVISWPLVKRLFQSRWLSRNTMTDGWHFTISTQCRPAVLVTQILSCRSLPMFLPSTLYSFPPSFWYQPHIIRMVVYNDSKRLEVPLLYSWGVLSLDLLWHMSYMKIAIYLPFPRLEVKIVEKAVSCSSL